MTDPQPVPMSAEVMLANLRPAADRGNSIAAVLVASIELADEPEAAALAVSVALGRLYEKVAEVIAALEPLVADWTDLMGPN